MNEITQRMIEDDKLHREFEALGMTRVHSTYDTPDILWLNNMTYLGYSYHWGDYRDNPLRVDMVTYYPLIFKLKEKEYTPDELKEYARSSEGKKELYPLTRLVRKLGSETWKYFWENYEKDIEQSEKFKVMLINLEKEINNL